MIWYKKKWFKSINVCMHARTSLYDERRTTVSRFEHMGRYSVGICEVVPHPQSINSLKSWNKNDKYEYQFMPKIVMSTPFTVSDEKKDGPTLIRAAVTVFMSMYFAVICGHYVVITAMYGKNKIILYMFIIFVSNYIFKKKS